MDNYVIILIGCISLFAGVNIFRITTNRPENPNEIFIMSNRLFNGNFWTSVGMGKNPPLFHKIIYGVFVVAIIIVISCVFSLSIPLIKNW